jgi:hypothetical protein
MYYIAYTCNIGYVTFVMMMEDTARHKMEGSNTISLNICYLGRKGCLLIFYELCPNYKFLFTIFKCLLRKICRIFNVSILCMHVSKILFVYGCVKFGPQHLKYSYHLHLLVFGL